MSEAHDPTVSTLGPPSAASLSNHTPWLFLLVGVLLMYLPVYWWAAGSIWQTDEQGHGPIILAVMVWLIWQAWPELKKAPAASSPKLGWTLFAFGLLLYVLGRYIKISIFEFGSQMFVATGALLLLRGTNGVRIAWFPLVYLVFMIPLPGVLVDAITAPLKHWISVIVVEGLYAVGYPIARSGVTITIAQYQMLVADACSGLNSMYSLSALGALFMFIMARKSRAHNFIMLASVLPIAFVANIVRVIVLVLVTYYLGDEAGQGFLHGAAGMVLMMVALSIFFTLDHVLSRVWKEAPRSASPRPEPVST